MSTDHTDEADAASLAVVRETRARLVQALNAFNDRQETGAATLVLPFLGHAMSNAGEGYVMLRETSRVDCSKFLIRPILEIAIRMLVIHRRPDLIYRVAYTEVEAYKTLLRAAARSQGDEPPLKLAVKGLANFKQLCQAEIPGIDLAEKTIRLIDLAEKAGPAVKKLYEGHYRVYCNFTHGSIEAVTRRWDDFTDSIDNETVDMGLRLGIDVLEKIAERRNPMSN